jgi:hypothetical protein
LLLEALCFLVLANRGWALVLGVSITVMHIAIASLMRLYFDFNVYASLIFLVNAPFWIAWIIRRFADHQEAAAHSSKAPPAGR